ncbi:M48 family metalloprotease [Glycomyces buryatensis]|uniref:Peptidase M48 domain-containing protein n=1 Tax=Glycomyces buryatensis TaxID=2570927 RepID=A0A4S8QBL9_9ACTN|nr:M48 family metalloprotease [Glycomyces buryatensis]THV41897.1 hypothetical protein FAB82_09265 [Glycomyces buryatensis]
MTATPSRSRLDERTLVAGTTVRFVQLIVLILAASVGMASTMVQDADSPDSLGCFLAAGGNPENFSSASASQALLPQFESYTACEEGGSLQLPWWLGAVWPAVTVIAALALFFLIPKWITWRRHLRPLAEFEDADAVRKELDELAGLEKLPEIMVDPDPLRKNPLVFGRNGRPVVLVPELLLRRRRTDRTPSEMHRAVDPQAFKAVMLHEFAHIRNRDTTITYITVALWWAFAATVLVPFAAWRLYGLRFIGDSVSAQTDAMLLARDMSFAIVLSCVIYLVRVEVLRNREHYADLAARRSGADLTLLGRDGARPQGDRRRVRAALRRLWDTHPRPRERWEVLGDNRKLFAIRPLPILLTGIAAILIGDQVQAALAPVPWPQNLKEALVALVQAGLITGVVGIALWRQVVYAAATKSVQPSGISAGLWLGGGMVIAELLRERIYDFHWLPSHPEALGLLVAAAVVGCWWIARCAAMWISVWRAGSITAPALLVLIGGALALAAWIEWWQSIGAGYANGGLFNSQRAFEYVLQGLGIEAGRSSAVLSVYAALIIPFISLQLSPLTWAAVVALLVIPLLAWLSKPNSPDPLWIERKSDVVVNAPLPRLRSMLSAAMIGGAACTAVIIAASVSMHRQSGSQETNATILIYIAWSAAALIAGAAVSAVLVTARTGRHRFPLALVAALLALPVGVAGILGSAAADGCVTSTSVFVSDCGSMPLNAIWVPLSWLFPSVAVAAAAAATVVVAVGSVMTRAEPVPTARPSATRGRWLLARRLSVSTLCIVVVGIAVTAETLSGSEYSTSDPEVPTSGIFRTEEIPATPRVKALQLLAWDQYGGSDLLDRFLTSFEGIGEVVTAGLDAEPLENGRVVVDEDRLRPLCEEIAQLGADARDYFDIPDESVQEAWAPALDRVETAGSICVTAIDTGNSALGDRALAELAEAAELISAALVEFEERLQEGTSG